MKVFIVESGDYEQRSIDLVAASFDGAIAAIKSLYASPYVVHWGDPDDDGITANFDQVPGFSTYHKCRFEIHQREVVPD